MSGRPADSVWDRRNNLARLRVLWAEGCSCAEIGRRLGISKNAVIGKAHRLHLPGRVSPIKSPGPRGLWDKALAQDEWERGRPTDEIGRIVGLSASAVRKYACEHDWLPRRHSGPQAGTRRISLVPPKMTERALAKQPIIARPKPVLPPPSGGVDARVTSMEGLCRMPLWGDHERPTHLYCGAPSVHAHRWCARCVKIATAPRGQLREVA